MNNQLILLCDDQLKLVSGGAPLFGIPAIDTSLKIIGLAHVLMGFREGINYFGARLNGKPIDKDDYFSQFFADLYHTVF